MDFWGSAQSSDSLATSPPKGSDGRLIYFHLANEYGEINEGFEELCITFKGNEVKELTKRLEGELGISGLTVCSRSPLNGKLYPLRLQLPPNNSTLHVIVVPPSSKGDLLQFIHVLTLSCGDVFCDFCLNMHKFCWRHVWNLAEPPIGVLTFFRFFFSFSFAFPSTILLHKVVNLFRSYFSS